VERENQRIRNGLRKSKGPIKIVLKKFVDNYNDLPHRGIGMSPNDACKKENFEKIINHENKYIKEFIRKGAKQKIYEIKDQVIVRSELQKKQNG
ncbi:hypothetical protein H311_01446, partial [Anncaliia algerae PRA109]